MTDQEHQQLFEAMKEREQKRCSWLRQLLVLASGALTVLVSLHTDKASIGVPLLCMRAAWVGLGAGILLGAVCLYGEVWYASEMVDRMIDALLLRDLRGIPLPDKISVDRTWWNLWSERLCYVSLIFAVISLVTFALTR
jgi:hypothetical protein